MNLDEYIKQQNIEKEKKIQNFVYNYENNTLYNIEDYRFLDRDEAEEILNILSNNKDKIQVANEIILKTGKVLPLFSLQFNQYYIYNGNIGFINIKNIYKMFYLNKNYINKKNLSMQIFHTINAYYNEQKNFIKNINSVYTPVYLDNIKIKQLYYMLYVIYDNLPQTEQMLLFISELLFLIYKNFLPINITIKTKKFLINIIAKVLIIDILYYYNNNTKRPFLKEKQYLKVLDVLISNWNLLSYKHKKILKNKSFNWIKFLMKKRNSNLEYKSEFLYVISKLE